MKWHLHRDPMSDWILQPLLQMKMLNAFASASLLTFATLLVPAAVAQSNLSGYSRVVYVATLPSVSALLGAVPAGLTVERIETTQGQLAITYKNAAGAFSQEAYVLFSQPNVAPPAPAPVAAPVPTPTPAPALVAATTPSIVYVQAPAPVSYYYSAPSDYPVYYQPSPLSYGVNPYSYYDPYAVSTRITIFGNSRSGDNRSRSGTRGGRGGELHRR